MPLSNLLGLVGDFQNACYIRKESSLKHDQLVAGNM